jgi:hypothetical protein
MRKYDKFFLKPKLLVFVHNQDEQYLIKSHYDLALAYLDYGCI